MTDDRIPKVVEAEVVAPYGLRLRFDDETSREVDMAGDLWGAVFKPFKDPEFFA